MIFRTFSLNPSYFSTNHIRFPRTFSIIVIFGGNIFSNLIFSKSKFIEFSKFQNLTFLKFGESYDSAIFYEQTERKILVLQANVPDVRQATQEPWNPTMLRNLTFNWQCLPHVSALSIASIPYASQYFVFSFSNYSFSQYFVYNMKLSQTMSSG